MDWWVVLVLVVAVAIILFPAAFIWYLNIGGIYAAIKEGRFRVSETTVRRIRIGLTVTMPLAVYALLIWFFLGHFGWQVALAVAFALPIVLFVPALVWAAVVSGLYQVVRDRMRRRAAVPKRTVARTVEERVTREVA